MAEIPSIGDILMLSQLAWKIGRAFTAGRKGAPAEFLQVETEVNGLAKALKLLAETLFAESDDNVLQRADKHTIDGVGRILQSCRQTINDLESMTDQYQVIKKHRTPGGFAIERSWSDLVLAQYKSMMWTTSHGTIHDLRTVLHIHRSTISLIMQAVQSHSLPRLESVINPVAEKIDNIHHTTDGLTEQLEEMDRIVIGIAGKSPMAQPVPDPGTRRSSFLRQEVSKQASPSSESFVGRDYFPPQRSAQALLRTSPPPIPSESPYSPAITAASSAPSPTARKRISEFSFGGSTVHYADSIATSDPGVNNGWPSPPANRQSYVSRQPSKRKASLATTPEMREPLSRPPSSALPPLPPPAMDLSSDSEIDTIKSISKLSLNPPQQPEYIKLHRSSTTASQKEMFEKQAFRNAAILCDVRGVLVEYAQKMSPEDYEHDVEMVEACQECRIAVVRKREREEGKNSGVRVITSIWVFSDDNTVRMELRMADGEMYVPYSSYFNAEKISVTVPCELKYHDVQFGTRPSKTAKTNWINYVFEDVKGATLFQNELMGRTLLATFRTEKTLRIHEGLSGTFSYQEQMCGMENLRIWEDDTTSAVVALIHFSAHFRKGYLAFYLNSAGNPIKVKEEGSREVKIKGLRVPLDKGALRKDSGAGVGKDVDKRKIISGARIEFATEAEKREFLMVVRDVQRDPRELPDLLGVN
ncbi:hypothetical protein P154DRAFT_572117 [Amniculicola lignicola CBS 123094]|uniref:Fungal N-terminal domain-containing protein n=1 Tax=Amniculicola lignicola CBS 123094 TaxID=1392246 RepID=A0A6A5WSA9_9PLEO|nr:hypothetical protein P154DRAFT_572117 [Amniculicola lignicola CBS 123094]